MRFKQFFEISDFVNRDASSIEFVAKDGAHHHEFYINHLRYYLKLENYAHNLLESRFGSYLLMQGASEEQVLDYFKNIYYIEFLGPRGHLSSGGYSEDYAKVYSHVLMAVKKFAEEKKLEGLVFSAFEKAMSLVYNKFIKNFTDFQIVDDDFGIYLSKKLLSDIADDYPGINELLSYAKYSNDQTLKDVRLVKSKNRNMILGMIGKAVVIRRFGRQTVGIVKNYDSTSNKFRIYHLVNAGLTSNLFDISDIDLLRYHPQLKGDYEALVKHINDAKSNDNYYATLMRVIPGDYLPYEGLLR